MSQRDANRVIAIVVVAAVAAISIYLIIRVSSVQQFGGRSVENNPIKAAEDGSFDTIPGIQGTQTVGNETPN